MATASVVDVESLPVLLRPHHVRELTDLSMPTVYVLLRRKGCPVIRFGQSIRVFRDPFLQWLADQATHADQGDGAER